MDGPLPTLPQIGQSDRLDDAVEREEEEEEEAGPTRGRGERNRERLRGDDDKDGSADKRHASTDRPAREEGGKEGAIIFSA